MLYIKINGRGATARFERELRWVGQARRLRVHVQECWKLGLAGRCTVRIQGAFGVANEFRVIDCGSGDSRFQWGEGLFDCRVISSLGRITAATQDVPGGT